MKSSNWSTLSDYCRCLKYLLMAPSSGKISEPKSAKLRARVARIDVYRRMCKEVVTGAAFSTHPIVTLTLTLLMLQCLAGVTRQLIPLQHCTQIIASLVQMGRSLINHYANSKAASLAPPSDSFFRCPRFPHYWVHVSWGRNNFNYALQGTIERVNFKTVQVLKWRHWF